ncbi:MAG TPA: peptidase M23 [Flavobacteriales bacterium]|nr:peptidase M23 [Flavobacteriales bacterium]HCA83219.1 peptidase M23 [Flavobacteriales bacterium]HRE75568.1 M23 family metallopeptidase [Flavobacteriales bacterium]HRE97186.1 M23 family metallopeptidase [Flavobacteriales bacterium]HRJ35178.1 M23 family metallopeptidase [Flavobacteriales bacterium]
MTKVKYKYNPQTLTYEKVEPGIRDRIRKALPYLAGSIVFAVAIILIYENQSFFKSPREQAFERENEQLRQQYDLLKKQMREMEIVLSDIQLRDDNIYRVIFESEPYPNHKRDRATGGSNKYRQFAEYESGQLMTETWQALDRIEKKLYAQSKSFDEVIKLAKTKEKMLSSIPAIIPVNRKDLRAGIGPYGWRIDPIYKTRAMHTGMDFPSETGTPVYATGDGKVINVESNYWGYGNIVLIDHGFGYQTMYAHLSAFKAKIGQVVKRGEVIGLVGSTGKSTAPHLHYEVLRNGEKVNPVNYYYNDLSPAEYEEMLKAASSSGTSFD